MVTSLTVGDVENVPIARNCPVNWKSRTVIELGTMESEVIDSSEVPVPLIETEIEALAVTTELSVFVY